MSETILLSLITAIITLIFQSDKFESEYNNLILVEKAAANPSLNKFNPNSQTQRTGNAVNNAKHFKKISFNLYKERKSLQKRLLQLSMIIFILLLAFIIGFQLFVVKPIEIKSQFNTSIQVITPYVDDKTINRLCSDWVLMKLKEDYIKIKSTIDEILEEQRIKEIQWSATKTILSGKDKIVS